MRSRNLVLVAVLTMLGLALCSTNCVQAQESSLGSKIGWKLGRGVANLTTGWVELPKQIYTTWKAEGWVTGILQGTVDGVGMLFGRTVAGAYEIVTFPIPIPPEYQPMLQPDYVWQDEQTAETPQVS
ncbi:MAG: exosortase system-associated protein, TIGR04073 family [Nitrospiraceae bacterium]